MSNELNIRTDGALEFVSVGACNFYKNAPICFLSITNLFVQMKG